MSTNKRITLDLDLPRHKRLIEATKTFDLTQQDLLVLVMDLTLVNLQTIAPHVQRFKSKKEAEANRQRELERKAKALIDSLTAEQQLKLLSGQLDLSDL